MTNHKELAERIVLEVFKNLSHAESSVKFDEHVKAVESILSEYQGEAVGTITGASETNNEFIGTVVMFASELPKKHFKSGDKVYLSAPIKKEE